MGCSHSSNFERDWTEQTRSSRTAGLSQRAKARVTLPEALCRYVGTGKQIMREGRAWSSSNQEGIIIMSIAENSGNFSVLKERLERPRRFEQDMILYPRCWSGRKELKLAVKNYLEKYVTTGYELKLDNLTVANGCSAFIQILGICICDFGDAMIIPGPFYPGFIQDLGRADVVLKALKRNQDNSIDTREFDHLVRNSERPVKALILVNPENPLGICYTIKELLKLVDWCRANRLHLISDEVYAQSRHSTDEEFISVATALQSRGDTLGDWVHIVYSMSKDFCLAGERTGFYYGENAAILAAVQDYAEDHSIPASVQSWTATFLSDEGFISDYFIQSKQKLGILYKELSMGLVEMGIPFVRCSYGLFIWADFREFLGNNSYEEERKLWTHLVEQVGILFTPGEACCGEPGFMRICFAYGGSLVYVKTAVVRLKTFVESFRVRKLEQLQTAF